MTSPPTFEEVKRQLPSASLLGLDWSWRYFYFAKFRHANSHRFQIGWLVVNMRAPWLERSAKALHPHLFRAKPECPYCGTADGLRYQHEGYGPVPPEYVCEACFTGTDTGPCFDDLQPV